MIKLSYITLFLVLLTLLACRKDKVPFSEIPSDTIDTCDCVPIEMPDGYTPGFNFINDSIYYKFPRFNPNNENEIIFTELGQGNDKFIYKYNLLTNSKNLVYQGLLFGSPEWGKSNWIIFTRGYNGVYRVRPDGTNLSLLIPGGLQFHPTFNDSDNQILTYHGFAPSGTYPAKIWNLDGELIDSMKYDIGSLFNWENQDYVSAIVGDSLLIIDPINKDVLRQYDPIFEFGSNAFIHEFVWLTENEALVGNDGLYKMNVWSGQREKVACGCSSLRYKYGDANEAGTKVLFNKVEYDKVATLTLKVKLSIVIFDVETNSFETIDIE
ncbi:MAG: hypothetical protein WED10_12190 [Brumimicrobium sp.]